VLDERPKGPAGSVRVELVIKVDVESILSVTAREMKTGKEASVKIRPSGGLSQKEIVEIITRRRQESTATTASPPSGSLEGGHVRVTTREQMVSKLDPDDPAGRKK